VINTVFKSLKSIEQLKSEYKWRDNDPGLYILIDGRGINADMAYRFGDGKLYEFSVRDVKHGGFTHKDVDEHWSYHESWFEEVEEVDFGIEELFEL
jgi:hypothetical protein